MKNLSLIDLEKKLLDPQTRKNKVLLNELVDEDFQEYGASGKTYKKSDILERLPVESPQVIEAFDFVSTQLSPTIQQIKFRTTKKISDTESKIILRSSLWKLSGDQWKIIFHQATPIT